MTEAVSNAVVSGLAWLRIERPEARNAINAASRGKRQPAWTGR